MKKIILLLIEFLILPFVYALEPSGFIENPWIVFMAFFLILFAIIYFTLGRSALKSNVAVCAVIALLVAFLATAGLFKEGFLGLTLANAAMIVGVVIIFLFLFLAFGKAAHKQAGIGGVVIVFGILFIVLHWLPKYSPDPYSIPQWLLEVSNVGLYIGIPICIIGIITFIAKSKKSVI